MDHQFSLFWLSAAEEKDSDQRVIGAKELYNKNKMKACARKFNDYLDTLEQIEKRLDGKRNPPRKRTRVTSPPYWGLRNYGTVPCLWPVVDFTIWGQNITIDEEMCELGQEKTPLAYIGHMLLIFREIHRVLTDDGTCWVNLGDS